MLKLLASLQSRHELEIRGLVMKCLYVCKGFALDVQFFCNVCAEIVHWASSCTCARLLHQLCNSCTVDTRRWFRGTGAHPHGAIKVVAPRRRLQSRFRCETTVVAQWASASPASLSRGTRSSAHSLLPTSTQSLLRNDTTGITIGSFDPILAVANAIVPFEPYGSIENVNGR